MDSEPGESESNDTLEVGEAISETGLTGVFDHMVINQDAPYSRKRKFSETEHVKTPLRGVLKNRYI